MWSASNKIHPTENIEGRNYTQRQSGLSRPNSVCRFGSSLDLQGVPQLMSHPSWVHSAKTTGIRVTIYLHVYPPIPLIEPNMRCSMLDTHPAVQHFRADAQSPSDVPG